jgi:hypothetical protein
VNTASGTLCWPIGSGLSQLGNAVWRRAVAACLCLFLSIRNDKSRCDQPFSVAVNADGEPEHSVASIGYVLPYGQLDTTAHLSQAVDACPNGWEGDRGSERTPR